jgi:phosphoserine phosphatase
MVTLDVDGTLTRVHGWEVLAQRAGRLQAYEQTNRRFTAREISEDEHLSDLLALAVGFDKAQVVAALEATPRIRGIAEAVQELHDRGVRVALLTHNPTYVCDWYRWKFGFDDAEGTPLEFDGGGRLDRPGLVHADKPGGLQRLLARAGLSARAVVHCGDGWADARIFPMVGAGVALNSGILEVRNAATAALQTDDLRDLLGSLDRLRQRSE